MASRGIVTYRALHNRFLWLSFFLETNVFGSELMTGVEKSVVYLCRISMRSRSILSYRKTSNKRPRRLFEHRPQNPSV